MFNTNVEAPAARVSNYFPGQSVTIATIGAVTAGKSQGGKDFLQILFTGGQEVPQHEVGGDYYTQQVSVQKFYLSENAWNKVTAHVLNRLADKTATEWGGEFASVEALVEACQVFLGKAITLSLCGEASYKAKDDGSGYWRNIYADFNPFMNQGTELPHTIEAASDFERVKSYFEANPLPIVDKGEPKPVEDDPNESEDDLGW